MGRQLVALGCPPGRLHVQPIAIHCDRYPFRLRYHREGEPVRLFFCASFREKKGLRYCELQGMVPAQVNPLGPGVLTSTESR